MEVVVEKTGEIVDIQCKKCGFDKSSKEIQSANIGVMECGRCLNCNSITYEKWLELHLENQYGIKCPFCQSTNVKKISGASKVASAVAFGVFALGKVTKTWHCNNCGSNYG